MKSLHLISTDERRGAETFAVDLATALQLRGDDAIVWALRSSDTENSYGVGHLAGSRRSLRLWRRLRREAAIVDVVVAHGAATLEAAAIGLFGSKTPFVYRVIGDPDYWVQQRLKRVAVRCFLHRAARIVVLWKAAEQRLVERYQVDPYRIDVIPNAVDAGRFNATTLAERLLARNRFDLHVKRRTLLYVGALSREKNVDAAIVAVAQLPQATLLVIGDGPERTRLEVLAHDLAPDRVRFLGRLPDPRPGYAAADLLLLPSLSEGMPAVIIEAGRCGVPTVASAVGAIPEMINNEVDGMLVAPADTAAFASAVAEAAERSEALSKEVSIRYSSGFSVDEVAARWQKTLSASLDARDD